MDVANNLNSYSYYYKGVPSHFNQLADEFIEELQRKFGRDFEISMKAIRDEERRGHFKISVLIIGLGDRVFVEKKGSNPLLLLKKLKKAVFRKLKKELRKSYSMKELRMLKGFNRPISI